MSGRKKHHHIIPRFLLRNFSDETGYLIQHDRQQARETRISVSNAAVRTEFYTIDTSTGPSDAVETMLGEDIEGKAASAFREICEGSFPPSPPSREIVSTFLALQYNRGIRPRESIDDVATQVMQTFAAMYSADHASLKQFMEAQMGEVNVSEERVKQMADKLNEASKSLQVALPRNFHVNAMISPLEEYTSLLYSRHWYLLQGDDFVIPDEPLVLYAYRDRGPHGVGLATADEILIPLSPALALCLMQHPWMGDEKGVSVVPAQLGKLRRMFWRAGHRFTFRHPSTVPCEQRQAV
jgi:hypothetical protein